MENASKGPHIIYFSLIADYVLSQNMKDRVNDKDLNSPRANSLDQWSECGGQAGIKGLQGPGLNGGMWVITGYFQKRQKELTQCFTHDMTGALVLFHMAEYGFRNSVQIKTIKNN